MKKYLPLSLLTFIIASCSVSNVPLNNINNLAYEKSSGISFDEYRKNKIQNLNVLTKNKKNNELLKSISINYKIENFKTSSNLTKVERKKVFLTGDDPTQKSHENINDKNIFDINNLNNLSGLYPYEGNKIIEGNIMSGSMKINDEPRPVIFESDIIILRPKSNDVLQNFINKYKGNILSSFENTYKIKVNLDYSNLNKMVDNINKLNSKLPVNITNIEFSSIASMKLFSIAVEFLIDNYQNLNSLELNFLTENVTSSLQADDANLNVPVLPINSNWLQSTNVFNIPNPFNNAVKPMAWDYSIGSNVNLAIIDEKFQNTNKDFSRRLKTNKNNINLIANDLTVDNRSHGTRVAMVAGAEKNNNTGIVGVAPNVNITSYYKGPGVYELSKNIDLAVNNKEDVINISSVFRVGYWDKLAALFNGISSLEFSLKKALDNNIPVIAGGNNDAVKADEFMLSSFSPVAGLIIVGGVDFIPTDDSNPKVLAGNSIPNRLKATFRSKEKEWVGGKGSGFGKDYVWAPWQGYMYTNITDEKSKGLYNRDENEGGTSMATAFTSGVVSLIKSRNKNLTPAQIEEILHSTASTPIDNHEYMDKDGFSDPENMKLIDPKGAVIEAIKRKDSNLSNYNAKETNIGYFEFNENLLNDNNTNNKSIGSIKFNNGKSLNILRTVSDEELMNADNNFVTVKGWDSSVTKFSEGFEVLNISPVAMNPSISSITNPVNDKHPITITGNHLFSINNPVKIKLTNTFTKKTYESIILGGTSTLDGSEFTFIFDKSKFNETGTTNVGVPTGTYSLEYISDTTASTQTNIASGFNISSQGLPQNITTSSGEVVNVVSSETKTPVVGGDKIAIPLTAKQRARINSLGFIVRDKFLTYYEMVESYGVFGIDPSIPDDLHSIIMKDLVTGENVVTFKDALLKTAIALGLKPKVPVTFSNGVTVQPDMFISDSSKLSVKAGDVVGVSVRGDLSNISIGIGDKNVTLQSIVDNYVSFKIPPDLPQGVQDVIIRHAGGNITFKDALDVLASNPNLPKNNKIIISAYDNGQRRSQIYSFDPFGSNIAQLTNTLYGTWSVSWSPDKSKITFGSDDTGDYEIYIMNADGTDKKKINPYNEYDDDYPFWSPDGKKIAYLKFGNRETSLVTINPDGTEFESYFTTKDYVESSIISWSPDSKKISCVRYDDESSDVNVYVTDIEKKTVTKINEPGYANFSDWTSDGKLIYTYGNTIMKSDADGTNTIVLYDADYRTINYMSTPVNGTKIAFSQSRDYGKDDIYIMDIDGSNLRKVLEENDSIDSFSWSPDGSSVVYYTNYFNDPASFWVLNINSLSKTKLELPFRYPAYSYLKWSTKNYKDKSNNKEQKNRIRISF